MPYITRQDGERFVVPSYRDTLSAKKKGLLKREILLLSVNYGEYITLQRKGADQYEAAFSPDTGYLLGESVWHYFKRPSDMVYCEAIPNTSEAILVIVKSGSVYLDGVFPIDSIAEELVVFVTQKNYFEIYIHGNVPISETPEAGKFSFDASSVKSFTVLDASVFQKLPRLKAFQLQLVDPVLRAHGIGVFPTKQIVGAFVALGLIWMGWTYVSTHKRELPIVIVRVVNPYQLYADALASPDPMQEMQQLFNNIKLLYTIPGWFPETIEYSNGELRTLIKSNGARTNILYSWAKKNNATIEILPDGFYLVSHLRFFNRPVPATISRLRDVIADVVDRLSYVLPGNPLKIGAFIDRKAFIETVLMVNFNNIDPLIFDLVGKQLKGLPLVLSNVSIKVTKGNLSGSISLKALGN